MIMSSCRGAHLGLLLIRTTPLVHITPNVLINTLILEAAHRAKVARFCFISSGAAYPPTADRPVREQRCSTAIRTTSISPPAG